MSNPESFDESANSIGGEQPPPAIVYHDAARHVGGVDRPLADDAASPLHERRRRVMHRMALELAAAYERGDDEAAAYCRAALDEMTPAPVHEHAEDLNAWRDSLEATPAGREALRDHARERDAFLRRYLDLKSKAGLSTLREVAHKAGISVATVQGIEAKRLKPQFRTLERLAKAFGVSASELMEGEPVSHTPK